MSLSPRDLTQSETDTGSLSARLQICSSRDEALEVAIKAAERSMKALKLSKDPAEKTQLSARVKQLLQDAERIKLNEDWRSVLGSPTVSGSSSVVTPNQDHTRAKRLREPQSSRVLPKSEQILLYKASYLNGFKFPPWTSPPAPDEFSLEDGQEPFIDDAELRLSGFQQEVFAGWKRSVEALPPLSCLSGERTNVSPGMSSSLKIDLVQDAATDCSVVASLCAGVSRAERGHPKLLRHVMHPYDTERETPMLSPNGKYVVRLNFNGCFRKVTIDDRLPTSNTSRVIHVIDRQNPGLVWPSLLEKAYLKVRGGYDFPGSNSGTDLWILTGWIPEQVFLQSEEPDPERLWQRMFTAFGYGDVIITMGTAKMSARAEKEIGLAGEHDYAVLDLREVEGQRLMLIKNPWCEGTSWRGRFNSTSGTSSKLDESSTDFDRTSDEPVKSSRDLLNSDDQLSPGTFWMDIDNVIQHFESIYLNWNPGLFACRQDIHFPWDMSGIPLQDANPQRGRFASLIRHPQFSITAEKGGTIWLLLCRHFQSNTLATPGDSSVHHDIDLTGFIALYAFAAGGRRVLMAEKWLDKSNFVDSPQILLKLEGCEPGVSYTIVPSEQELPSAKHTFTISAFSNSLINLQPAPQRFPHSQTRTAAWTKDNAGGNAHSPRYSVNPQFSLNITQRTRVRILLEADSDELNVHFKLVHGKGQRVRSVRNRDIVFDSADYRRRCCVAESADVGSGCYTIICSTFEPQQLSTFSLSVESDQSTQLELLPKEGAGRLRSDLGVTAFAHGSTKLAIPLTPQRLVKLYAVARQFDPRQQVRTHRGSGSLVRVTIELGQGPHRRILIASGDGEYSDSSSGPLQTDDIDLSPEMRRQGPLWLVLERMYVADQALDERFAVELFVDQPGALQCGAWRAWEEQVQIDGY